MNPKFTVIITAYNRANLLERAILSLKAQKETDWEAWIIDDGSVDHTPEVSEKYINDKIKYIRQTNQGEARAKNKGLALANGEYLTFLDSDDEYHEDHLSLRRKILEKDPSIDIIHGGVEIIGDPYVPDRYNPEKKIHLSKCTIGGTFFFRRPVVYQLNGFKDMPIATDGDLWDRAQSSGFKSLKTDLPTYIYHREDTDSITHRYWKKIKQNKT